MTTQNNEIVITESAMKKVLSSDETLRLKCLVESLHEKVLQLEEQLLQCNRSCKEKSNAGNEEKTDEEGNEENN